MFFIEDADRVFCPTAMLNGRHRPVKEKDFVLEMAVIAIVIVVSQNSNVRRLTENNTGMHRGRVLQLGQVRRAFIAAALTNVRHSYILCRDWQSLDVRRAVTCAYGQLSSNTHSISLLHRDGLQTQ
uniref:Uncharacterized protein n=1 Tax=Peronospora matthiolae TaxID=2874970 RepID=A0AAV1UGD8_9STRA